MTWRWPALALTALLAAAVVWLAGFTLFEREARRAGSEPPAADGIVALTGGVGRVEAALRLLAEGKAPRLLVSGVGAHGDLPELGRAPLSDRITLGRDAADTVGNAAETAAWARRIGARTLIVVTAGYHMSRALREIGRELPDVTLYPFAVQPPSLRVRVLAVEYDKLLAAWSGLSRWRLRAVRP